MKKIFSLLICFLFILCSFGCEGEKSFTEEEAIQTAEKLVNMLFTSDAERFEEFKSTDFYEEDAPYGKQYGYESLFMYLLPYREICTDNALITLSRIDIPCVMLMDTYVDMKGYDRCTVHSISSMLIDENDETVTVCCTVQVAFWKGDVYILDSADVHVDIRKTDSKYDDGKTGQVNSALIPVSHWIIW